MHVLTENNKSIPVYIGVSTDFTDDERSAIDSVVVRLQSLLAQTPLVVIPCAPDGKESGPAWFCVVRQPTICTDVIKPRLELAFAELCDVNSPDILLDLLQDAIAPANAWRYTLSLLPGFSRISGQHRHRAVHYSESTNVSASIPSDARIIAAQLAALERFNREFGEQRTANELFITRCTVSLTPTNNIPAPAPPVPEAPGLDHLHAIGAAADFLATQYQARWQRLMLATTSQIAALYPRHAIARVVGLGGLLFPATLILFGLLAAFGYATFTELSGGCKEPDRFLGELCMSPLWKHWLGPTAFFGLYSLPLAWAWCRYAAAKADRVENKHQDYRLLAECLRVQYALGVLGKPLQVQDLLPLAEHAESGWVRQALLSLEYQSNGLGNAPHTASGMPAGSVTERLERVHQDFVVVQTTYHTDKLMVRREHAVAVLQWMSTQAMRLFLSMLLILAIHVATELVTGKHLLSEMGHHVLIIAQIGFLAFWGSMRKVNDLFGLELEIQRGKLVLHALNQACTKPADFDDLQARQERIVHALRVFAADQAAWHALRRAKPIEAATGA